MSDFAVEVREYELPDEVISYLGKKASAYLLKGIYNFSLKCEDTKDSTITWVGTFRYNPDTDELAACYFKTNQFVDI